jgi:hypothetical protein
MLVVLFGGAVFTTTGGLAALGFTSTLTGAFVTGTGFGTGFDASFGVGFGVDTGGGVAFFATGLLPGSRPLASCANLTAGDGIAFKIKKSTIIEGV